MKLSILTLTASLLSLGVQAVPVKSSDIKPVTDANGATRYQASEPAKGVPHPDALNSKSKQFHEDVLEQHKQNTDGKKTDPPNMSSAQYHAADNTIQYSSTGRGGGKGLMNDAYQKAAKDEAKDRGVPKCTHPSNGRCAEGGTTSQNIDKGSPNMKGDMVSSYGTAKKGDSKEPVTAHHPGCSGKNANQIGCKDVLKNQGITDVNHPKPGVQDAQNSIPKGKVKDAVGQLDPKQKSKHRGQDAKQTVPQGKVKDTTKSLEDQRVLAQKNAEKAKKAKELKNNGKDASQKSGPGFKGPKPPPAPPLPPQPKKNSRPLPKKNSAPPSPKSKPSTGKSTSSKKGGKKGRRFLQARQLLELRRSAIERRDFVDYLRRQQALSV